MKIKIVLLLIVIFLSDFNSFLNLSSSFVMFYLYGAVNLIV